MKDSFVFYSSYADAILQIDNADSQMKTLRAIWNYAFNEIEPEEGSLNTIESIIFSMARPTIEASKRNYENGLKGGRPRKTPLKTPLKTNDNVNENLNLNETYNEKETVNLNEKETVNLNLNGNSLNDNIHKKNNRFYKPTLEQVESFCKDKNLGVNPEEFFEYYETTNWENVYNWQALIVAWNKRQIQSYNKVNPQTSNNPYAAIMEA